MNSFINDAVKLPLGSVWLMNAISEYKGKHDVFSWFNYFLGTITGGLQRS